jgi:hypothetical protein
MDDFQKLLFAQKYISELKISLGIERSENQRLQHVIDELEATKNIKKTVRFNKQDKELVKLRKEVSELTKLRDRLIYKVQLLEKKSTN